MELLGWFLLAALLVLSPITWLKPSVRQKQLIRLRDLARSLGIKVTLTPLQLQDGRKLYGSAYRWLRAPEAPIMPGYICLLSDRLDEVQGRSSYWKDGWILMQGSPSILTDEQRQAFDAWLDQLPKDSFAVEWGSATLSLWWEERGSNELLEELDAGARQLLQLDCKKPHTA
ncbi:hypothetical protein [Marinospirillum perlucidum]|uniref:hypothetical protein n=1 Tax=Marinospirillum perlucidum TaxID=1982602 RepID=UPI001390085E|nr:hypothetical protein [Marinospirillum perlucidum]